MRYKVNCEIDLTVVVRRHNDLDSGGILPIWRD